MWMPVTVVDKVNNDDKDHDIHNNNDSIVIDNSSLTPIVNNVRGAKRN